MAETTYALNDPETVKRWATELNREVLSNTTLMQLAGSGPNNVIQIKDELSKGAGDRITMDLRMQGSGAGRKGDSTLEGHEEALVTHTFNITIDQLRHAFKSGGRMSEQRVPWSIQAECKDTLADWWADRLDTWGFNQLCGYTVQSDTRYTGNTSVTAPDSDHILRPGALTTDEGVEADTTATFAVADVDRLVNQAQILSPLIRPVRVDGGEYYVLVMHPNQVRSLRDSSGDWFDAMRRSLPGSDNPIWTGALGAWNGVIFRSNTRVTNGVHSSTGVAQTSTRRAVLLGAQAGCMAFGQDNGPTRFTWVEDTYDFKNKYAVAAGIIGAMAKTIYNSADYGSIVYTTYAIDP